MYQFKPKQIQFLRQLSDTMDGKGLKEILHDVRLAIGDISNIPSTGDYGAQVEGRRIAIKFIDDILDAMKVKETMADAPRKKVEGDDWT